LDNELIFMCKLLSDTTYKQFRVDKWNILHYKFNLALRSFICTGKYFMVQTT
jgi:hypothetical protein